MNAPPVQYVTTSDGVSIAYTMRGEGPPLVCLPFVFSHAQQVWESSSATPLLKPLSERFRVIYYDARGQGLSQRGLPPDTAMAAFTRDLEAVLETLGLERPVLLGDGPRCQIAVRYALENPERVRALALIHCAPSFAFLEGMVALARTSWDYFLTSQVMGPTSDADQVEKLSRRMDELKERTTQQDMVRTMELLLASSDITEALRGLSVPTIVLHPSHQLWVNQDSAARSAALIPGGRLVVLNNPAYFGDEEAAAAIAGLLDSPAPGDARNGALVTSLPVNLTHREFDVLRLIAAGKSNQEIAETLVISLNTVLSHVSHIYDKTGAANRVQATAYARDHALL